MSERRSIQRCVEAGRKPLAKAVSANPQLAHGSGEGQDSAAAARRPPMAPYSVGWLEANRTV